MSEADVRESEDSVAPWFQGQGGRSGDQSSRRQGELVGAEVRAVLGRSLLDPVTWAPTEEVEP